MVSKPQLSTNQMTQGLVNTHLCSGPPTQHMKELLKESRFPKKYNRKQISKAIPEIMKGSQTQEKTREKTDKVEKQEIEEAERLVQLQEATLSSITVEGDLKANRRNHGLTADNELNFEKGFSLNEKNTRPKNIFVGNMMTISIYIFNFLLFSFNEEKKLKSKKKLKKKSGKRKISNSQKNHFAALLLILLMTQRAQGAITVLSAGTSRKFTHERTSQNEIALTDRRISKVPTEEKTYLTYVNSNVNSGGQRNFLEKVDYGQGKVEIVQNNFLFNFEFYEEDSNKFVFHLQANTLVPSVYGFGTFNSATKTLTLDFQKTVDSAPYSLNTGFIKSFAYSHASNYFMFCKMAIANICQVTAGDMKDENSWRASNSPISFNFPPSFFLLDPVKVHSTGFAMITNLENFLLTYDYTQNPLVETSTTTKTSLMASADKFEISSPAEKSNYLAIGFNTGAQKNVIKFTDINLKSVTNIRTVTVDTLATSVNVNNIAIFGVKSTNFFILQGIMSSNGNINHNSYVVDNKNGQSAIEFIKINNNIFEAKSNWYWTKTYYVVFEGSEYGEVMLQGLKEVTGGTDVFEMYTIQLLDYVCHPSCGATGCTESGRKGTCKACVDTTNMDQTGPNPYTCTCKSTHSFFELSSKTCIQTCTTKNEVTLDDGVKYCLTDAECKARRLYPTTGSGNKKICVAWNTCAKTNYFDLVNEGCEKNLDSKTNVKAYNTGTIKLGVDQDFCEKVKKLKSYGQFCYKECTDTNNPFYYLPENTCLNQANCEAKSSGSTVYVTEDTGKLCLTKEQCKTVAGNTKVPFIEATKKTCILKTECNTKGGKVVISQGECLSTCPASDNVLSLDGKTCYTKTNCPAQTSPKMYLASNDGSNFLCLTQAECQSDSRFLFNTDDNLCKKKNECKIVDGGTAGTCVTNCPTAKPYYLSTDNTCYSDTSCKAKSADHLLFIDTDSSKHCITKATCKAKGSDFYVELTDKTCIKSAGCTRIKVPSRQECAATCDLFLNQAGKTCYTSALCTGLTGGPYYAATGETGQQKYCFNQAECKAKTGFLFNVAATSTCIKTSSCSQTFKVGGECRNDCPYFLNNAGNACMLQSACTSPNLQAVPTSSTAQKYCLTQAECKSKSGFLLRTSSTTCIDEGKCSKDGTTEYWMVATGECTTTACTEYLDNTSIKCYSSTACKALSGGNTYFTVGSTGDTKKYCLTKSECQAKTGYLWDEKNKSCIKEADCTSPRIKSGGDCQSKCQNYLDQGGTICYTASQCQSKGLVIFQPDDISQQKQCITTSKCKTDKNYLEGSTECSTKTRCQAKSYSIVEPELICTKTCPDSKKFRKSLQCYTRCQTAGEFGQMGTNDCVLEKDCKAGTLKDGTVVKGKGNTSTGECFIEYQLDDTKVNGNNNFNLNTQSREVTLNYYPRDKTVNNQGREVAILLPFDISLFKKEDVSKIVTGVQIIRNRRILQENVGFQVVPSSTNQKEGYVTFQSPTNEQFKAKVLFNTGNLFVTTLQDGTVAKFQIKSSDLTFIVQKKNSIEEPTGYLGIATGAYYGYVRVISPLIGPNSLVFLSQNYERQTLLSHFNFWEVDKNDWLYVKTFKDWIAEAGKLVTTEDKKAEEIKEHCDKGKVRHCFYKKNFNLMTAGLAALIILGLYLILLVLGIFARIFGGMKGPNRIKNLILYNTVAKGILSLQTNFIFYAISSLTSSSYDLLSFLGSIALLIITVAVALASLKKKTKLNTYFGEVSQKGLENVSVLLIIFGIVYDIGISVLIAAFKEKSTIQAVGLLLLEITYVVIILITKKFKQKILLNLLLIQRILAMLQAGIGVYLATATVKQETWHLVLLLISFTSIVISIVMTIIAIMKFMKKDEGKEDDKSFKDAKKKGYVKNKAEDSFMGNLSDNGNSRGGNTVNNRNRQMGNNMNGNMMPRNNGSFMAMGQMGNNNGMML